ncbi:cytochrome P450 [Actinomadura rudentiformis]|uniref:cytochrome P450 n=1 Tax=Actinomadura rudentiformis TaxID=359158 RepID=UPI001CEFA2CC|nr:cytochrome P450 [Actinomadura rudentiformis]
MNLFAPEVVADPQTFYERLRTEHGPVAPVLVAGDLPAWLVLGYRENLEVARTSTRFTRDSRVWNLALQGKVPADSPLLPMTEWKPMVRFAEGEAHRRLRSAINDSLAGLNRRGVRRYVTRFANELIDGFCTEGRADLVAQFAQHLPMHVMAKLLGIPDHAAPSLVRATQDLMTGAKTAVASNEHIVTTLRQVVAQKRAVPGNDIASRLIGHPAELSDMEVAQNLRVALVIGNETTVGLVASTLRMVHTDPRCRASLAGGHMTLPDAVEQILWDEPPFRTMVGRWAVADTELGGQKIKAGDLMLLALAAGNVDPAIRPDLTASLLGNRSHLAFGGGAHECPGQDISRAIAETGIDTLLGRLPDISLAVPEDELTWNRAWLTRHLASLPVTFTPKRPTEPAQPFSVAGASEAGQDLGQGRDATQRRDTVPWPDGAASPAPRWPSLRRRFAHWLR